MRFTAVISSKGQIVIPAYLRKRYGMKEGTTVVFQEDRGRLLLAPSNFEAILAPGGGVCAIFLLSKIWSRNEHPNAVEKTIDERVCSRCERRSRVLQSW